MTMGRGASPIYILTHPYGDRAPPLGRAVQWESNVAHNLVES
jgi:hypothetical protein